MPRAIWSGAISFGMVTIPVSLFPATQSKDLSFHLLHEKDNARIKNHRFCSAEDREVPADEIVKGYEVSKGEYVIVEEEDFEKLPVPSKHTIEISAFVEAEEIPPVYYEHAYYLEPEEIGVKSYRLLLKALEKRELVAIGKIALRQREHLCAIRPGESALLCETLYWGDEVREAPKVPQATVSERELDMAYSLIELLQTDFEPRKYKNEYREALLDLIEAKQKGQKIEREPEMEEPKVIDLMEALRASINAASKGRSGETRSASEKKKPSKTRRKAS